MARQPAGTARDSAEVAELRCVSVTAARRAHRGPAGSASRDRSRPPRARRPGRTRSSSPLRQGRKAHEDGVDVAAGLQPEQSASVIKQVELDIAAAEDRETVQLLLAEGRVHPLADDLRKDVEEG